MRCQHNQKISCFCITETCTWKECAGCQNCMKKYHNHIGKTTILKEHEMSTLLQKLIVPVDIKAKCRNFQESIYHYFNFLKTQLNNCLDNISRSMISRLSSPYVNRQGYLNIYKKFKNNDYRKFTSKQLIPFINFLKGLDEHNFIQEQRDLYHVQANQSFRILTDINKLMHQLKQSSKSYYCDFDCGQMLFQKIIKVNETRIQDSPQRAVKNNKIQINIVNQTNSTTNSVNPINLIKVSQPTTQSTRKPLIQLEVPADKVKKQRKVSIDHTLNFQPIKKSLNQYDKNEREIEERMKKLMNLMNKSETAVHDMTNSDKQEFKKLIQASQSSNKTSDQPQILANKISSDQKSTEKQQDTTQLKKQQLFNTFIEKGLNIPELLQKIVAHTDIPITQQKKKLYENSEDVKKKTIKVAMVVPNDEQEPMSPILKKRKKRQSANFTLGLTKTQESPQVDRKIKNQQPIQEKEIQQNIDMGENQGKSLALLIASLRLPTKEAIPLLQSALKHAENNLSAAQYLSYLYLDDSRAKDCLDLCNKMLQKMQHSAQYQELSVHLINNKAAAYNLLGRYSESIAILQQLIKKNQKDIFYKNLADAYYCVGIYEKAIGSYQKAVELNPQSDEAYFNMAVCQVAQQHYHHAKLSLLKCLKLAPKNTAYLQFNKTLQKKISEIVGS